jgi:alginate O-acetyltransferase complex protein AlgI
MWTIAVSEFIALKLLTLATASDLAPAARKIAYLTLWPGMDAREFLADRAVRTGNAPWTELMWALSKMGLGLLACAWAITHAATATPLLVGWIGMIGLIFTLHFGLLHVISWCWRQAGIDAPPIMRAPIAADSLADFWSARWNKAFADAARRLLFRPLVRRLGALGAGGVVFLVSGLVHETVISLPARGGWGGPTVYFLLQGGGIAVERSRMGKRLGLGSGRSGWLWTLFCTAVPLPLLFHPPFVLRVIVPFFQQLKELIP